MFTVLFELVTATSNQYASMVSLTYAEFKKRA